jgi:hypothetical protein
VNRQQRHDIGYWMSIIGFAVVVSSGIFGSLISMQTGAIVILAVLGFLFFLLGAEMALRNGTHDYPFHHEED